MIALYDLPQQASVVFIFILSNNRHYIKKLFHILQILLKYCSYNFIEITVNTNNGQWQGKVAV